MKTIFATTILMAFLSSFAVAEFRVTSQNLNDAFEIPGSRSLDNKYALFCINRGETTATFVGIMRTNRGSLLSETQLFSHGADKKEYGRFLTVIWSNDSKILSAHDSSQRHSRLQIYEIKNGIVAKLNFSDLLSFVSKALPSATKAQSSGQPPVKWLNGTELLVSVRFKDKGGKVHTQYVAPDPKTGNMSFKTKAWANKAMEANH